MSSEITPYVTSVIHGEAKVGKTYFGTSGPGKTLVFDAEAGGMRFVTGNKVRWDVDKGDPIPEGTEWGICQVPVSGLASMQYVRNVLLTGRHPFNNISIDSLTEIQDQTKRERSATFQLQQQDWGYIFGIMNDVVVSFRDIVAAQEQLVSLTVICGTTMRNGLFRPMINGQFGDKLPYKLDLSGFLISRKDDEGKNRRGLVLASDAHEVGHRLGAELPDIIWDPTITGLLNTVFGTNYKEPR